MDQIKVNTKYPVAFDSQDHLNPWGTKRDNSLNLRFNSKLYKLFNRNISVLDLGCAGGAFVRSLLDDGNFAFGLDGSDYSKKFKRAEWGIITHNLDTADITKEFHVVEGKKDMKFDVITMWEVLEHIKEKDLNQLFKNINNHLKEGGLFIVSVSNTSDKPEGIELHETRKPRGWWINKISQAGGLLEVSRLYSYFNSQYIRGRKQTHQNFNLIFSKGGFNKPVPKLSSKDKFLDNWFGSKTQIRLRYFITGRA
jgi:2-polyprenyl-3-methyl-5-hydroxy-6-metoxy-1,4-benzoquinol methylase